MSCSWGQLLFRGLLALFFGIYAFMRPGKMLLILVIVNAAFWIVDGIFMLFASASGSVKSYRGLVLFQAIIGILAGIAVFTYPVFSTLFLVWMTVLIIAVITMISGIKEIVLGAKTKNGWLIFGGIIYVLFALVVIHAPILAGGTLVSFIGIFVAIGGVALTIFSLKLRSAQKKEREIS
jgi:uncharacterized membrane protein HdeD (DUF308 family)